MDELRLSEAEIARYTSMTGSEQYMLRARAIRRARMQRSRAIRDALRAAGKYAVVILARLKTLAGGLRPAPLRDMAKRLPPLPHAAPDKRLGQAGPSDRR